MMVDLHLVLPLMTVTMSLWSHDCNSILGNCRTFTIAVSSTNVIAICDLSSHFPKTKLMGRWEFLLLSNYVEINRERTTELPLIYVSSLHSWFSLIWRNFLLLLAVIYYFSFIWLIHKKLRGQRKVLPKELVVTECWTTLYTKYTELFVRSKYNKVGKMLYIKT